MRGLEGEGVSLEEMLSARELRAHRQRELLERWQSPLLCFTMNIPGPVKDNPSIRRGFARGAALLRARLEEKGVEVLDSQEVRGRTGSELYLVSRGEALSLKTLAAAVEDGSPLGRLFDMDVLDRDGRHVSREELGLEARRCLLCGGDAKICARSRAHPVSALQEKTATLLREAFWEEDSEYAASLAVRSLLYEVVTTPKPGLVDCRNTGSHRDMDLFSFLASATALQPYFRRCVRAGMETGGKAPEETFRILRGLGKRAEETMYAATGGVNTHKGAIFSLGLLCGALGRLERETWGESEAVLAQCSAMVRGLTARDFQGVTEENAGTAGERFYVRYGVTGVRGQAEAGFPAVGQVGLPKLEEGLARGLSLNDAGCAALLALIAADTDTNLIARGGLEVQRRVAEAFSALLRENPFPGRETLERLDDEFIEWNLSPGGSADLLALTYFLHELRK